jgi:hypothetical protein
MTNDQKKRVESIYYLALKKSTAMERDAYLDSACGDDSKLRASVEEMLDLHARAGDFLETPILGQDVTLYT